MACAYRKRATGCHPDKKRGSEDFFVTLTEAHDRLMNIFNDMVMEKIT